LPSVATSKSAAPGRVISSVPRPVCPKRLVDDQKYVLGEGSVELVDEVANASERSMIPTHAEDAIRYDDGSRARPRRVCEMTLELCHLQVRIDALLSRARQSDRVDDAVVVEFVGEDSRALSDQRRQDPMTAA
jgi:hypothetical protein